ncbi:MAG: hypothetical protein FWG02_11525 [Holophagaceae bacterium]|nr:hypothetical protein [Holophagaceae bacterium]
MLNSPKSRRILLDTILWLVVALCTWFALTRHFLASWVVSGRWQVPSIVRVHVGSVEKIPSADDFYFDRLIVVKKDGSQKIYRLLKEQLYGVQPEDNIWLINSPFVAGNASPPTFRFSIPKLFIVFPEFFLLVCGCWLFFRFRSRLGKPFDEYEGPAKPTSTYVVPSPDSWGRSKNFINKKDHEE